MGLLLLLLLLLELERAEVKVLQALDILDDTLLGDLLLLGCATPQDLLQALYLHQPLLDGRIVRIRLQHLKNDLEFPVLLLLINLLIYQRLLLGWLCDLRVVQRSSLLECRCFVLGCWLSSSMRGSRIDLLCLLLHGSCLEKALDLLHHHVLLLGFSPIWLWLLSC